MEQSYFQIQLDRAIKETEKLLKQLNAIKTDYEDKRIEEALEKSVTAAKISEAVALKTRALLAHTGHPQADAMVQNAIEEGEVKIKHHLHTIFTPMMSYEFPLREAAIIFGADYVVALNMLKEMKETQKMDNGLFHTYKDIFFVPMDDFGVRLLRVLTTWNWQERILKALFDPDIRSYNRGSFTYDAHENGEFQFSFLDGNIWRLFRFREAILNREGKFKIICYSEQLPFLRKYIGDMAKFSTVTMENAERILKIKGKSLI